MIKIKNKDAGYISSVTFVDSEIWIHYPEWYLLLLIPIDGVFAKKGRNKMVFIGHCSVIV
jgi:hypothetical protein